MCSCAKFSSVVLFVSKAKRFTRQHYKYNTGFSTMLIKAVLKKCKFLFTLDDVIELVPVYKKDHAVEILCMIKDVFDDIDISYGCVAMLPEVEFLFDLECGGYYDSEESSDGGSAEASLSEMSGVFCLEVS